ncbi:ABC transporter substrate-binding protein [Pseudomonas donghuensis]|uniref:ABC transporter substrate-binding protein n=1 Tax=Pseudomonas donghuensis TaxID=1163398 RepID=UPI0039E1C9C2
MAAGAGAGLGQHTSRSAAAGGGVDQLPRGDDDALRRGLRARQPRLSPADPLAPGLRCPALFASSGSRRCRCVLGAVTGQLQPIGQGCWLAAAGCRPARFAATPGGIALRDRDACYQATELAGYGFAINPGELHSLGLRAPRDWPDLLDARLRGRIALPDPAQVGFAPVLLDIVLQAYGWDKGWALWSELAGQSRLVSRGGTLVSDEVASGRSVVGVSIDFFVASAVSNGQPVEFVYPTHGGLNPAHIAITRTAKQVEGARAFVRFVLSPEGQTLLADPDIRKLPVRPGVYAQLPADYHDPFAAARQGSYAYANDSSRERLALITSLFEQWLGQPHEQLSALWARVHAGEAQGRDLTAVREFLSVPPIDEDQATSATLLALFGQRQDHGMLRQPVSDQDALGREEIAWQFHSARQQAQAERLLAAMGL